MMLAKFRWVAIVCLALALVAPQAVAQVQQQPSPGALAVARELARTKGAQKVIESALIGILANAGGVVLQSNPGLAKDLEDVSFKLQAEYAPQIAEQFEEIARAYAQRFTEQELKEALAFYQMPVGKKLLTEEPRILFESSDRLRAFSNKLAGEMVPRMFGEMKKRGHRF
jgi:hypothetical protein